MIFLKENRLAYLPIFGLAFIWAFFGPLLRFFESLGFNAFDVNFLAFGAGTILLFLVFWLQKTDLSWPNKPLAKKTFMYALGLSSTNVFLFYAFTNSTIASTIVLHYTALLWSAIWAVFFFKEKMTKWKTISIALTIAGIAFIFLPFLSLESKYFFGNVSALFSSFGYAAIILASRSLKNEEPKRASFYGTLFCALIFLPFFILLGNAKNPFQFAAPATFWGLYSTAEVLLLVYGMSKVSVIAANLVFVLEIPAATALGIIFYSEPLTASTFTGSLLILCATMILILKEKAGKA